MLRSTIRLGAPLLSSVTGQPVVLPEGPNGHTLGELVRILLDMIFLEPVEWAAVQDSIVSLTAVSTSGQAEEARDDCKVKIVSYGPGYGMSAA